MRSSITRSGGNHRMSNVVKHNGTVYLAGQVAERPGDITDQTREVLGEVEQVLLAHGSSKENILSCQIFLADIRLFHEMNAVWDQWVPQGHAPARATLEARLARTEKLIEVCVVAAVASGLPLSDNDQRLGTSS